MGRHKSLSELKASFWLTAVEQPNGCMFWPESGRNHDGYGRLSWSYGLVKIYDERAAHKIAWILTKGHIPLGQQVLHSCDNPPCINPSHLSLGTELDNMRDKIVKGRIGELGKNRKLPKVPEGFSVPCASCGADVLVDTNWKEHDLIRYGRLCCSRSCAASLSHHGKLKETISV